MEQVITLEWGGLLRETEIAPAENRKKNGRSESSAAPEVDQAARQEFLQGLENALALPPEPGMSLYEEDVTPSQKGLLERFAGNSAAKRQAPSLANSPDKSSAAHSDPAAAKSGTYQPRLMWMGTGFEERQVLIAPPQPEVTAPEPPPASALDTMSVETVLEDTPIQAPSSFAMPAEAAVSAPQPQSPAAVEELLVLALTAPESLDVPTLDSRLAAPPADAAVLAPSPSNGSQPVPAGYGSDGMRWFVLNGMVGGTTTDPSPTNTPAGNIPVLEIFSLAGGVGKTSLAATLCRALSARGERVLLVEATPFGTLPYYFGACDCRPGELRTFRPPASSTDAPIRLATVFSDLLMAESAEHGSLATEIQAWAHGANRVIVDVATGSTAAARNLSTLSPTVLVPLVPDVNSVIAAHSIDSFFQHRADVQGVETEVYYVLNQFDPSLPLHVEVSKVLRSGLGERLLPFALERNTAVSEALADGMTVMDYAPESSLAEDFTNLAKWVEQLMAPAQMTSRSTRWSER